VINEVLAEKTNGEFVFCAFIDEFARRDRNKQDAWSDLRVCVTIRLLFFVCSFYGVIMDWEDADAEQSGGVCERRRAYKGYCYALSIPDLQEHIDDLIADQRQALRALSRKKRLEEARPGLISCAGLWDWPKFRIALSNVLDAVQVFDAGKFQHNVYHLVSGNTSPLDNDTILCIGSWRLSDVAQGVRRISLNIDVNPRVMYWEFEKVPHGQELNGATARLPVDPRRKFSEFEDLESCRYDDGTEMFHPLWRQAYVSGSEFYGQFADPRRYNAFWYLFRRCSSPTQFEWYMLISFLFTPHFFEAIRKSGSGCAVIYRGTTVCHEYVLMLFDALLGSEANECIFSKMRRFLSEDQKRALRRFDREKNEHALRLLGIDE